MSDSREDDAARRRGAGYRRFWAAVGRDFPDLDGARSTRHYRRDEEWLLGRALPDLDGRRLLKTDLWDEAKNTRILSWLAGRGAACHGVDISPPIVGSARRELAMRGRRLSGVVADVRALPYRDGIFDAVYSMGTVEHFEETEHALTEIRRVLRPGGRAVIGVPNRFDPFARPLLVWLLHSLGLYGYGDEKCYSRRVLRRMLERAGLTVEWVDGILFLPGWLRMLDLACWTWARPLAKLTAVAVGFFDTLSRRWPRLRRHGYLLAALAVRADPGDGRT
ncbi:MAG: class I SAM-dependent methyltransferase [Thermoanaerobaculia bacterium]|nr:class I SAM-dependent methyltransferase [Thermoanaerobaculia bacterium]